jgi:hypothetical protein
MLVFAILVTFGLFLSSVILPFQTNAVYADQSETNTQQGLSQENIGSGDSTNNNCGHNSIDSIVGTLVCREGGTPSPTPFPPGTGLLLTLEQDCAHELICTVVHPEEFFLFACLELPDGFSCRAFLRTGESVALTDCILFGRQAFCRVAQ